MYKKEISDGKTKFLSPISKIIDELYGEKFKLTFADSVVDKKKKIVLSKINPGYEITISEVELNIKRDLNLANIKAKLNRKNIIIDRVDFFSFSFDYSKGRINQFYSLNFKSNIKRYRRLAIKTNERFDFSRSIQERSFNTERYKSRGGMNIYFRDKKIEFFSQKIDSGDNYIFFDSCEKITFEEFSDLCFSISIALGFVTGKCYLNEGIFFSYTNAEMKNPIGFKYTKLRGTIKTIYSPVYNNPYGYRIEKEEAEKLRSKLRRLTEKQFSKLCRKIYESGSFSATILLIIESMSSSLIVAPSGLAIVLEGLTNSICKENEDKVKPIPSKKLAKEIRKSLKKTLESYEESLSNINEQGMEILNKKVDNINSPTNRDKLLKPFEILGISISKEDEMVINSRNDFLHGRITLEEGQDELILKNETNRLFYIMLRLFTLNSALILKSIGFRNYIVNFPKTQFRNEKILKNEGFYRKI